MNQNLLNQIAAPTNTVANAFEARTNQLDQQRKDEAAVQRQRDNDMLKVFEFAGDGMTEEAKIYAKTKGIEVPEQIYQNSDFAKGLTLAGKLYGSDPVAAQKFTTAWSANPTGDFQTRLQAAQAAAGVPIDPADRDYQRKIQFEMWKINNLPKKAGAAGFSLSPGQTRYDQSGNVIAQAEQRDGSYEAYQKAYNATLGGMGDVNEAHEAGLKAAEQYKMFKQQGGGQTGGVSPGLMMPPQGAGTPVNTGGAGGQVASPQRTTAPPIQTQPPPSGLPAGSVMIGTANGRPVYQAPNGERFIDDGNP